MPWGDPACHFRGVDNQGHVSYSERIGEADFDGGLKIPLFIIFDSSLDSPSALLGAGWNFPLLEAWLVSRDDKSFQIREPGGWDTQVYRSTSDPTQLTSSRWQGTIAGDIISLQESSGDKMVFNKGRIQSMTLKGRTFDYLFNGSRLTEIREGNVPKVQIVWNSYNTEVVGLKFNGKQLAFERTDRPKVVTMAGRNEIRGKDRTLGTVTPSWSDARKYTYGIDTRSHPTMKTGTEIFTWDPVNRLILSDKEWTYQIKPGAKPTDYAAIGRTNAAGKSEYWYNDQNAGVETVENADGTKWVTTRFVTGPQSGRIQKQEKWVNGALVDTRAPSYDAQGKLTGETKNDQKISVVRDEKGRIVARVNQAGEKIYEIQYDAQDRKILEVEAGSYKNVTTYTANGRHEEKYDGESKLKGVSEYDLAGHNIMWSYPDGKVGRRLLDANGHTIALFLDGRLQTRFLYDSQQKLIQQIDYKADGATVALVEDKTVVNPNSKGTPAGLKWAKDLDATTRKKLTDEAIALTNQLNESLN